MLKKISILVLLFIFALPMAACGKEEVKVAPKPVVEEKKEEPVLESLPDEEAAQLIEKVRTYAEVFDLESMDHVLREAIKKELSSGVITDETKGLVIQIIAPLMEASIKDKIAEGLVEYTGQSSEDDIETIYEYMNTEELFGFVASYEIQRLKQEGFLR